MPQLTKIAVAGGGTGGHISPAVAIVEALGEAHPAAQVIWFGRAGGMEERTAQRLAIPFFPIATASWPRKRGVKTLIAIATLGFGFVQSLWHMVRQRPEALVAVGGFVCVPPALAAQVVGIPTILHEQNKRLGMAHRLLAKRATRLLLSFPETEGNYPRERAVLVGNPVREGFVSPPDRAEACQRFGLDPAIPVVLVSGGSQGAHTLNAALEGALEAFAADELQVIWAAGRADTARWKSAAAKARAKVAFHEYIEDMPAACAAAAAIVSRAGASTTAEIAAMGKPSVLVPYPYATDAHQDENARAFREAGAALVFADEEWTAAGMIETVRMLLDDPVQLAAMAGAAAALARLAAARDIVGAIEEAVEERRPAESGA